MPTTKAKAPGPDDPIRMRVLAPQGLSWWVEGSAQQRTAPPGAVVEVPRGQGARWVLLNYAEPAEPEAEPFEAAELAAGLDSALEALQRATNRPDWDTVPRVRHLLDRMERLTRPGRGPQEAA